MRNKRVRTSAGLLVALAAICAAGAPAAADVIVDGGQVNGAGATLFVDFFKVPASTNDDLGCGDDRVCRQMGRGPVAALALHGEREDAGRGHCRAFDDARLTQMHR